MKNSIQKTIMLKQNFIIKIIVIILITSHFFCIIGNTYSHYNSSNILQGNLILEVKTDKDILWEDNLQYTNLKSLNIKTSKTEKVLDYFEENEFIHRYMKFIFIIISLFLSHLLNTSIRITISNLYIYIPLSIICSTSIFFILCMSTFLFNYFFIINILKRIIEYKERYRNRDKIYLTIGSDHDNKKIYMINSNSPFAFSTEASYNILSKFIRNKSYQIKSCNNKFKVKLFSNIRIHVIANSYAHTNRTWYNILSNISKEFTRIAHQLNTENIPNTYQTNLFDKLSFYYEQASLFAHHIPNALIKTSDLIQQSKNCRDFAKILKDFTLFMTPHAYIPLNVSECFKKLSVAFRKLSSAYKNSDEMLKQHAIKSIKCAAADIHDLRLSPLPIIFRFRYEKECIIFDVMNKSRNPQTVNLEKANYGRSDQSGVTMMRRFGVRISYHIEYHNNHSWVVARMNLSNKHKPMFVKRRIIKMLSEEIPFKNTYFSYFNKAS